MSRGSISRLGIALVFLSALFLVNSEPDRTNFGFIAVFYCLAFISYLLILRERENFRFVHLVVVAGLAHFTARLFEPNLSDDFYRFLWDGEMTWQGINVFDFKPNELANEAFMQSAYMQELYTGLSDLSKENYSCYPPVNQLYFIIATGFTSSVAVNVFIMKLLIVLTEVAGAIFLRKLLLHLSIQPSRIWVLFLNPLLIIESTGNTHFEGVMLSLLLISFYYLITTRFVLAAIFFGLAVQIKLVPLLLLPFFVRYFGWKKSFVFYAISGSIVIGLGLTQLNAGNILHFLESLALYFRVFEFNSFIFHNCIVLGEVLTGYNQSRVIGPILSGFTLIIILVKAFKKDEIDWEQFFNRMLFGFFIYMILSSTQHPWYGLTLLMLSVFTNYSFPVLWSFLIFFSYFFYSVGSGNSFEVRLLVSIEYVLLFGYVAYEFTKKGSPLGFLRMDSYFQPIEES
jgi:alpha-1,6-mannosyltransferase